MSPPVGRVGKVAGGEEVGIRWELLALYRIGLFSVLRLYGRIASNAWVHDSEWSNV